MRGVNSPLTLMKKIATLAMIQVMLIMCQMPNLNIVDMTPISDHLAQFPSQAEKSKIGQ